MKSIIIVSLLLTAFVASAETRLVELQFSTNSNDIVSAQIDDSGSSNKEFEQSIDFDGEKIGIGSQLIISKFTPKDDGEIYIEFSACKRSVSEWKKLSDGSQVPFFKVQELKDTKLSVAYGKWINLGKLPNQEPMRIRITKGK